MIKKRHYGLLARYIGNYNKKIATAQKTKQNQTKRTSSKQAKKRQEQLSTMYQKHLSTETSRLHAETQITALSSFVGQTLS